MSEAEKRMEEYVEAIRLAKERLAEQDPTWIASRTGGSYSYRTRTIALTYLGREVQVSFPDGDVYIEGERAGDVESVLILHYLVNARGGEPGEDWVSYRDLPGARYHYPTFRSEVEEPLSRGLAGKLDRLVTWAKKRALPSGKLGDFSFIWRVFPRVPLLFVFNDADEDFPAEMRVFFDSSAPNYLPTEDLEVLAQCSAHVLLLELEHKKP
jgi:hypothetical protein